MVDFQQNLIPVSRSYRVYRDMLLGLIFNETAPLNDAGRISHIFGPTYEMLSLP